MECPDRPFLPHQLILLLQVLSVSSLGPGSPSLCIVRTESNRETEGEMGKEETCIYIVVEGQIEPMYVIIMCRILCVCMYVMCVGEGGRERRRKSVQMNL